MDDYSERDLPAPWEAALRFTDRFLAAPGPIDSELQSELDKHFTKGQQTELGLGLGLFHGFSKMLIALGLEPDQMDTTVLPTPPAPPQQPASRSGTDPYSRLLRSCPELAARWQYMHHQLLELDAVPDACVDAARGRVAQLIGVRWERTAAPSQDAAAPVQLAVATAEAFVIDVRGIDDHHRASLVDVFGNAGMVQLIMALAIYDGIYRVAATTTEP